MEPEHLMNVDRGLLKSLPKVLLHEHLDGVLRPETVIDLAKPAGYDGLPTTNPEELAHWFHQGANRPNGSLRCNGLADGCTLSVGLEAKMEISD